MDAPGEPARPEHDPSTGLGGPPPAAPLRPEIALFRALSDDRAGQFAGLLSRVLTGEDPEAVHDLRVWSRRMQQILDALYSDIRPRRIRSLRRRLRRIRRRLGGWRDCDIALEFVRRKRRSTRSGPKRHAWELVAEQSTNKRTDEILRARRWLLRGAVARVPAELQEALKEARRGAWEQKLPIGIRERGAEAAERWRSALQVATTSSDLASVHAFRVATKRLRYRLELDRESGRPPLKGVLSWLRQLQASLGQWHDRQTFYRLTAVVLARAEILLEEPEAVRIVLGDLEKERGRDAPALAEVFSLANAKAPLSALEAWTAGTQGIDVAQSFTRS